MFRIIDTKAINAGVPVFRTVIESAAGVYLALLSWERVLEYMDDLMVVGEPILFTVV